MELGLSPVGQISGKEGRQTENLFFFCPVAIMAAYR